MHVFCLDNGEGSRIKEFAEAASILRKKYNHLRFILVAPLEVGSHLSVPDEYVLERQETGDLIWLKFRKDVREIYALSDLAVLPSYYKEGGYPRALLEPMAMGKPVIAADVPDCRGPVEDSRNGYLVPPRDSRALADAIEKIVINQERCREFGTHSRARIESIFDERLVVAQIIDTINRLHGDRSQTIGRE